MKKLFAIIAAVMLLVLTSCNNSQDNSKRTDNPSAELKTLFKLDTVDSGNYINEYDSNAKDYYTIKTSANKNDSLFIYTTSIDEKVKNINTQIDYLTVSFLRFENAMTQDEVNGIKSAFYKEEILKAENFGLANINANSINCNVTISSEIVDNIKAGQTGYKLTTVYIPTLVTHVSSGSTLLEVYLMLPLYTEVYQNTSTSFDGLTDLTPNIAFENSFIVKA